MTASAIAVFVLVLGACVLLLLLVRSYNSLVNARQTVSDAWAVIDLELQRRHDLIPYLVETVRAAAVHEQHILDHLVAREREAAQVAHTAAARSKPEEDLVLAARAVLALREMYPSLNSQQNFLRLQHDLTITEDRIGAARRFHNIKVAELNRRTEAFPSNLIAQCVGIDRAAYFGER